MTHIYFFKGESCCVCHSLQPQFEAEIKRLNLESVAEVIDCEEREDLAQKYGIRGIPHIVVEKDGEIIERGHAASIIPRLKGYNLK